MMSRVLHNPLNGRFTARRKPFSYEVAESQIGSYHWSSTEYYRCTARYVYFGNGFAYNYYKYFGYVVRPVAAFTFVP